MATKKKLLQAAAGSAGGEALNVEEVFSTYLYDGNGSTQTITNGIDLSGEGGLVWIKDRDSSSNSHMLYDTERGAYYAIKSNTTGANQFRSTGLTAFNSNGFTLGSLGAENGSGNSKASWTFRKAPKFFDVVTYTGNGTTQNISHNLGSIPGMIIVKRTDAAEDWIVYHRESHAFPQNNFLRLNLTNAVDASFNHWDSTLPTDSVFTVGSDAATNASGGTYVAYLFAHNNGDGEFGPDGDADIIKCGSYTGNGSSNGPSINLGFEPQWIIIKKASGTGDWIMFDNMRGITPSGTDDTVLLANSGAAEYGDSAIEINATGFKITGATSQVNTSSGTYIYIAIRRGQMAVPESATDVFDIATRDATHPSFDASFDTVDFTFVKNSAATASWRVFSRLQGQRYMSTDASTAELSYTAAELDHMNGWSYGVGTASTFYSWMWKRAPNFCDVVAYTGNGTAGRTVSHNLGVAPEMMWVKNRSSAGGWVVYAEPRGISKYLFLNGTDAEYDVSSGYDWFYSTAPTSTDFTLNSGAGINGSGSNYIAYLFASLDGVSKVGSYTGNGSSNGDTQDIDCGFTSGARFVLIKRTSSTGNWMLYDTERGIVSSGDDKRLELNGTGAEDTNENCIEPLSSGFTVRWDIDSSASNNPNISGSTYIFYAIA